MCHRHYPEGKESSKPISTFTFLLLTYGIEVWGGTFQSTVSCLIKLQKKIVWLITNSNWHAHTNTLFTKLQILTMPKLHNFSIQVFVHKYEHNVLTFSMICLLKTEMYIDIIPYIQITFINLLLVEKQSNALYDSKL